jgi:hypothetical protein
MSSDFIGLLLVIWHFKRSAVLLETNRVEGNKKAPPCGLRKERLSRPQIDFPVTGSSTQLCISDS